jgi:Fe-S cluster assembly ATP-binding protein
MQMTAQKSNEEKKEITSHQRPEKIDVLEIDNLQAKVEDQEILKGLSLTIKSGEIHAIMGPNGSGKSTLCKVLMGHPKYEVTGGNATFNGENILEMEPEQRAALGLFLGFQHPIEVPGVTLGSFLRQARTAITGEQTPPVQFMQESKALAADLKIDPKFIGRNVNEGFSGGEKKRAEIFQLAILEPKFAFLDEIDSGLDIDALKIAAEGINKSFEKTNCGILLITHYQRILNYVQPHFVHIMKNGRIIESGDKSLAEKLEAEGYENLNN